MANNEEDNEYLTENDILDVIELENQNQNGNGAADDEESADDDAAVAMEEEEEEESGAAPASVEEVVDNSMITFSMHTGEVFSVDVGPVYAASGGEDDRAFVWNIIDGRMVFEVTGHSDSVTYVRFNARSTMLATACIAGFVQVWRTSDFTKVGELQVGDLSWLKWHHAADILFCGAEDGSTWMYLVPNGDCKVYAGYGPPCTVGELFPDGKRLCAGYGDGGVRIWDLKTSAFTNIEGGSVHKRAVTCAHISHDGTLIATGSEEGTVNLIHASSGKIITTFACARSPTSTRKQPQQSEAAEAAAGGGDQNADEGMEEEESISVEAVSFSKMSPLLFTGTVNGEMAIWDLNSHVVRQSLPSREGVVKATWIDHCVLVADLGGVLRLYDSRNGESVSQWTGHKAAVLDFGFSSDAKTLVSCSSDRTCKVYQLDNPNAMR